MPKIAIVAALEREVEPLVRGWQVCDKEHEGRRFRFFENDDVVVLCGGIGPQAARCATEAIITLFEPAMVYSAGFAGALDARLKVGTVVVPRRVVDSADGSSIDTGVGEEVLVSFRTVAGSEQKKRLGAAYNAVAIDMEAAAVAKGAQAHGLRFAAVKVISDKCNFTLPPMDRSIDADGKFHPGRFMIFVLMRPWWWAAVIQLARNSRVAARELCRVLERLNHAAPEELELTGGRVGSP